MQIQTFTDFDAFRASNPQVDGQWLINGGKDYWWKTEFLPVGYCLMIRCTSHTGLITEGVEASECYQFYVPFGSLWKNNGAPFSEEHVLIVEPGADYCVTCREAEGFHGFIIPKHLVAFDKAIEHERARSSYTIKTQRWRTDQVRNLFDRVIKAAGDNPEILSSPASRMIEVELRSLLEPLLKYHPNRKTLNVHKGRPRFSRREILHKAHAVIESFADEPIHISELADLIGVSERTLRIVFNEFYQIGPLQYLRLRELHKIRQELIAADARKTTVTDVLARCGVWEFGRFSGRYKHQFGELPQETLSNRHKRKTERPPETLRGIHTHENRCDDIDS